MHIKKDIRPFMPLLLSVNHLAAVDHIHTIVTHSVYAPAIKGVYLAQSGQHGFLHTAYAGGGVGDRAESV